MVTIAEHNDFLRAERNIEAEFAPDGQRHGSDVSGVLQVDG
jgi:hypothetical protein